MSPILSPNLGTFEIGGPYRRLGPENAQQVFDVMLAAASSDVIPPGVPISVEDAVRLFDAPDYVEMSSALGVFGYVNESNEIAGFVALAAMEVDSQPFLEFYIFFRPESRKPGLALDGANRLLRLACSHAPYQICTLIYEANALGKRFYTKAGFRFDRHVVLGSINMEMWIWDQEKGR